jgi:phosphosulfolactate synthase (CoM biosynthesis protein A)
MGSADQESAAAPDSPFGCNVNRGNVPPEDILALEALRDGLRGDTLKKAWEANKAWKK